MARKPTPITIEADDSPSLAHVGEAANALALVDNELQSNTKALAIQLKYDGSLNPDALESGIRDSQARVSMELFHIGSRLLLLKEQCEHGEFMQRCERLDISQRVAQQIMQVTLRFSNAKTSSHLTDLGRSKLLELLILDDGEIQELSEAGSVRGIELDDIDRMSVRELRKQLRDSKAQAQGTQKLLADKNQHIDELYTKLNSEKLQTPELVTPSMELQALLSRVSGLTDSICNTLITEFNSLFVRINDHHAQHGGSSMEVMSGFINRISNEAEELRGLFGLRGSVIDDRQEWDTEEWDAPAVDGDAHTQAELLGEE